MIYVSAKEETLFCDSSNESLQKLPRKRGFLFVGVFVQDFVQYASNSCFPLASEALTY